MARFEPAQKELDACDAALTNAHTCAWDCKTSPDADSPNGHSSRGRGISHLEAGGSADIGILDAGDLV
jgi:hypothetical protein